MSRDLAEKNLGDVLCVIWLRSKRDIVCYKLGDLDCVA